MQPILVLPSSTEKVHYITNIPDIESLIFQQRFSFIGEEYQMFVHINFAIFVFLKIHC